MEQGNQPGGATDPGALDLRSSTNPARLWSAVLRSPQGERVELSVSLDASSLALEGLGMSVAARRFLRLDRELDLPGAIAMWSALAHDPRERFSETSRANGVPIYALAKPVGEDGAPEGVFGVNGGGEMGLNPCVSIRLPRALWGQMAIVGATLLENMRLCPGDGKPLSGGAALAACERIELMLRAALAQGPLKKAPRVSL